ncbi:sigma-70 family RNA polymerase sigma factor [Microbacterium sp.]|uniref:sigma-70 family RNA polymerase sigma factor n=1 Tax=Microbacterium sp. TaxID=51671 RepID=UPI002BA4154A|nr:sigma-70 family RNA polymerase sigma factor [Microbacterium sp.]HWK77025.1 sigma-70 family RNA polymerase sigma factor [Microbacterium sp.]
MTVHNDFETGQTADADLILRTRSGDADAFSELWRRHYPSGIAVARSITSSIDPDDLVQEAFARIFQAVVRGGGPNGSFRAYLFTSIRNTAAAWGRARRETPIDELESIVDPDSTEQAADEALDRSLTAHAFRGLPTRWQEVLWYTEIEQMKPAEVAPLLGMRAGAVSQLAFRAREGLREAWIQAHVRSTASDSECHWTIAHLGAHSRGNLSTRDQKRLDAHLDDCARCIIVAGEVKDVSSRLALVLLPLVLGVTGAAGYTALLQQGTIPAIAVAGMPSDVVSGAVVATGIGAPSGLAGTTLGGSGAAAGSTSGAAPGGAISGIGALVGAGSAALVVAGVVAAATVVPGLVSASPVTSLPSAGDADGSSISSELVPGNDIEADEMLVLELPAPDDSDDDVAPRETQPPSTTPEPEAPPVDAPTAVGDARPGGNGGDGAETTDPVDPTDPPVDPTDPTDPPVDPTDPTDPIEPSAPVDVTDSTLCLNDALETVVTVELQGFADAAVQPLIASSTSGTRSTVLDQEGLGAVTLKPTLSQILSNSPVDFDYVDFGPQFTASTTLSALGVSPQSIVTAPSCSTDDSDTLPSPAPPADAAPAEDTSSSAGPTLVDATPSAEPGVEASDPALSIEGNDDTDADAADTVSADTLGADSLVLPEDTAADLLAPATPNEALAPAE